VDGYVAVRYDADAGEGSALAQRYGVRGFPTFVLVDPGGRELDRFSGYRTPEEFVARLRGGRRG
jgi:thioredoxin-related protein